MLSQVASRTPKTSIAPAPPKHLFSVEEAWEICRDLYEGLAGADPQDVGSLEDELLFCLLGGFGVSYELNLSTANAVRRLRPFAPHWDDGALLLALERLLSSASFEPRRRDGSLRRYRFPKRKAALIVSARGWISSLTSLKSHVAGLATTEERRTLLCRCPGVGPKTASWLLRNLQLADDVAIIDVHVYRALIDNDRIDRSARLPRDYAKVERAFLAWCSELDADPGPFDLFLWEWQRGSLAV